MARTRNITFVDPIDMPDRGIAFTSYLYIVREEDARKPIKVGRGKNAKWRMSQLQTGNPRTLELVATWSGDPEVIKHLEKGCHKALSDYRLSGEWFDIEPEPVIEMINRFANA